MKIGILTLPFKHNYGGYLQAYALLTVLKNHSFDVYLIDRELNKRSYGIMKKVKGLLNKYVFNRPAIYSDATREAYFKYRGSKITPFVDTKIVPKTVSIYSSDDFVKIEKYHFDAIIVGSDQVWRPMYVPNIEDFYLEFAKEWPLKRISYAASFGTDDSEYIDSEKKQCGELLKAFDAVSVREKSGLRLINDIYKWNIKKAEVVLDPTMLLCASDYHKLFPKIEYREKRIFCYILDMNKEKKKYIHFLANKMGYDTFFFLPEDRMKVLPSIEDFLFGIASSEFVLTDSFHGTVFSMLFNTNFLVFGNQKRGMSRISDLLSIVNLNSCLVDPLNRTYKTITYDWENVNHIIQEKRSESLSFLLNNLSVNKSN